jgi:Lanthionine synthetase C-like protein
VAPPPPDALWSPEAHEGLAGDPWSERRARDAIAAICRDAEEAFDPERLWPAHPLDGEVTPEESLTLYLGGAGMVWALDRLAGAGLHEPRRDWAAVAADLAARAGPLPPSLLLGRAGILLVSWLLHPAAETADLLALEIAANVGNETNELLWGSPGTMLAAAAMIERGGEEPFADLWGRSAAQLLDVRDPDGCWTQDMYGQATRYLGAGHGFAGNAHALLGRPDLLDDSGGLAAGFARIAIDQAVGTHETANWPPFVGGSLRAPDQPIRVQWCHGAPGVVASLAGADPGNEELTRILAAGGELTWRAGPLRKGAGLCHGTAGNAFAFLSLLHRTGDERWLERARAFAMHAAAQVERARAASGRGRYSLWTGDVGTAILLQRCFEGSGRGLPTLDAW